MGASLYVNVHPDKPSPLVQGFRVDRYEMLCPIAEGGMASVWVARLQGKHGFEKLVAIKTILPRFASDPRFRAMFLDEARIASRIEHVNVARILDLGEEHGVLYLVMEWVDGDALSLLHRTAVESGAALPHGIVLRVLADVCAGLHAAHETSDKSGVLGVVHRDVSPQNILVSVGGVAKVIDFGIAKVRDRVAGDTSSGTLKGKIRYMAPEQALGQGVDRRADVWAVGAILYHLLSGYPPFEGPNEAASLVLLTSGKPPLPLPGSVPSPVVDVVCKALSHDPRKRYASALEMQRALERAMSEAGLAATAADVAEQYARHLSAQAAARRSAVERALATARATLPDIPTSPPTPGPTPVRTPVAPPFRASTSMRWAVVAAATVVLGAAAFIARGARAPERPEGATASASALPPPTPLAASGVDRAARSADAPSATAPAASDAPPATAGVDRAARSADAPSTASAIPPAASSPPPRPRSRPGAEKSSAPPQPSGGKSHRADYGF